MGNGLTFWGAFGLALAFFGIGVNRMNANPFLARICFTLSAMILLVRLGWWLAFEQHRTNFQLAILAFVIFGGIGSLWLFSMKWISDTAVSAKEAIQRPWLELFEIRIEEPLQITNEEMRIKLGIAVRNYGSIPATNIIIIPQMAAVPIKDSLDLESGLKKALEFSKNMEKVSDKWGASLFPNKIFTEHHFVRMPRSEILSAVKIGDDHLRVIISLGGCINYRFGESIGQTTFNFVLKEMDSDNLGIEITPRVVSVEKLVLQQIPLSIKVK